MSEAKDGLSGENQTRYYAVDTARRMLDRPCGLDTSATLGRREKNGALSLAYAKRKKGNGAAVLEPLDDGQGGLRPVSCSAIQYWYRLAGVAISRRLNRGLPSVSPSWQLKV